jgi:pyruvate/2-oxoglutarate dehydrogenase complex dihydrolipoamide acyltransferase (E2) component
MDLHALAELRSVGESRVGWTAIFTKAFALVAREMPEFRRAYLEYPRPRLYEHPYSAASVAIERDYQGEPGVFFAYLDEPERTPLAELDAAIKRFKTDPVEDAFGFTLWFYKFPRFFRRFTWWWILTVRGSRKAEFLGTFGVSSYAGLGAESLHPLSPLTATVNYGVIGSDGLVPVRIVYDHRVMDGATVARALGRMEEVLTGEIATELRAGRFAENHV